MRVGIKTKTAIGLLDYKFFFLPFSRCFFFFWFSHDLSAPFYFYLPTLFPCRHFAALCRILHLDVLSDRVWSTVVLGNEAEHCFFYPFSPFFYTSAWNVHGTFQIMVWAQLLSILTFFFLVCLKSSFSHRMMVDMELWCVLCCIW